MDLLHNLLYHPAFSMKCSLILLLLSVVAQLGFTNALLYIPPLPKNDPFYAPPANLSKYLVGDIIDWRPTPQKIRTIYVPVNIQNSWQFKVRSTDSFGNPSAIITTLLQPYSADPTKLWSYQIAEDAAELNCASSYAIQFATQLNIEQQAEMIILETGLAKGWYVVVPDYEGLKSTFTAGWQSGHAVLDSIRAVLQTKDITNLNHDAKVQMFGYSGGSLATGWAVLLQSEYYPALTGQLIGTGIGGVTGNLTEIAIRNDGTIFAGFVALALRGLLNEYPALGHVLNEDVSAIDKAKFLSVTGNLCLIPAAVTYLFQTYFKGKWPLFKDGEQFFNRADVKAVLNNNTMALNKDYGVPTCPIFIHHGKADEIIPFDGAERVYNNWCEWGVQSCEFNVANTTGHILELVEGCSAALTWHTNRFAGIEPVSGCQRVERVTNLLYPGADLSTYQLLITLIESVLGKQVGEGLNRSVNKVPVGFKTLEDFLVSALAKLGNLPFR